ncbi:MAG: hypothetical protein OHK0037_31330 [Elainellaceae cyanobacterium]
MSGALRDTDGWFNSDTEFPGSSQPSQAEFSHGRHAIDQDGATHPGDRLQDCVARKSKPKVVLESPKHQSKISPEFGARLEHLKPQQKIRAVVMLEIDRPEAARMPGSPVPSAPARRQTPDERKAAIARIRAAAQHSLDEIRPILEAFHASLLASSPDAVGAVPVEIDAAGIPALAQSSRVRTILEDQAVRPIDGSRVRRPYSSPFSH